MCVLMRIAEGVCGVGVEAEQGSGEAWYKGKVGKLDIKLPHRLSFFY